MIQKFIAGLSAGERKVLFIALFFAIVALFDRLLLAPTMSKLEVVNLEITKEQETIRQDKRFLNYKDRILKESKVFEPYYIEQLPSEEEIIAAFLKKIESVATESDVTLVRVTPATGAPDKNYLQYQADLECSGKLVDLVAFMHKIDTSNDLMKVVKFSMGSKKGDSDEIKSTMTVHKMIIPSRPLPEKMFAAKDLDKGAKDDGKSEPKQSDSNTDTQ